MDMEEVGDNFQMGLREAERVKKRIRMSDDDVESCMSSNQGNKKRKLRNLLEDIPADVACYHRHLSVGPGQCHSVISQEIRAPIDVVWSVVRRFDRPDLYKPIVKSCEYAPSGDFRRVHFTTGLPFESTTERCNVLDDQSRVMVYSVVGGDACLSNYCSVTSLHPVDEGRSCVAVESYVVDTCPGNTEADTRCMLDAFVSCNLRNLARVAQAKVA